MTERTINAERVEQLIDVFGSFDENVRRIEDAFGVKITNRNNELKVTGDEEGSASALRRASASASVTAVSFTGTVRRTVTKSPSVA